MSNHEKINYIELPAKDIAATKTFYEKSFGWGFVDYGDEYVSITEAGIDGGFYKTDVSASYDRGSALVVLFSDTLEQTQEKILAAGGTIAKPTFSFPGGRRFHFYDPNGNELAVWSDK